MTPDAKYPSGDSISIGDRVWWDDGTAIGYIHEILDSENGLLNYGLEEDSVIIRINDPIVSPVDLQTFAVPLSRLEQLGVWKMSQSDSNSIDAMVLKARSVKGYSESDCSCSIYSLLNEYGLRKWRILFYHNGSQFDYYESANPLLPS